MANKEGKKRRVRASQIVCVCVVLFIILLFIAINIACYILSPFIDGFLVPSRMDAATRAEGRELAIQIEQEGIVMTKNNGVLPLNRDSISSRVNIFGWDATKWVRSGDGSGRSGTSRAALKYDLLASMTYRHLKYNEKLIRCYRNFRSADRDEDSSLFSSADEFCRLYEPSIHDTSIFSGSVLSDARTYSDTAFVVLGRTTGESIDCPKTQYKQVKKGGGIVKDETRTYLDISTEEEELLTYVGSNFDKVVVIINSSNVMNLGFMDTIPGLDACLIVSGTGGYGALAILDIVYGIISPSGRTVDTYAYDLKSAPSYVTAGMEGLGAYQNANGLYPTTVEHTNDDKGKNFPQVSYADYAEDIYVGYKWYETADAEGYFADVDNKYGKGYNGVVQYPFGYGLSYTTFSKEVVEVSPASGSIISKVGDKLSVDEITVSVRVTNTGKYPGREVVQLYFSAPYTKGGIEKSSVVLAAFAKTSRLDVGESEVLTLKFSPFDMASYDYNDKNDNGFKGYELEDGTYRVMLMKNSHELDSVKDNKHTITYKVTSDITIEKDPVSGGEIKNRFSAGSAEDGIAADGTETGENITYLTRSDFAGTFPHEKKANRAINNKVKQYNTYTAARLENDLLDYEDKAIITNRNKGLKVFDNDDVTSLGLKLGGDYDAAEWDDLLNQMSLSEMKDLVLHGYVGTRSVSSIGMPTTKASDGPAHIGSWGSVVNSPDYTTTPFPQTTVLAQTWNSRLAYTYGLAMGKEARLSNIDCWYGPGINLHRHPFGGRNYEYWSEDSLISGTMCAQSVKGALDAGVYSTIKHLALYNTDTYRDGQYVWLTEQNLRENYLKGFRIAVQQGGATGIMSSYNRIGAVWTGASSALQNSVLRGEFGFRGFIITDYCDHREKTSLMLGDAMIRNGGDLWMDGFGDPGEFYYDQSSPRFCQAVRTASKNIIYAYLNAAYTNDVYNHSDNTEAIIIERNNAKTSWWVYMVIGIDVLVFLGCAFWVYMVFFHRLVKRRLAAKKAARLGISADTPTEGTGFCMNCGTALSSNDKFCLECGTVNDSFVDGDDGPPHSDCSGGGGGGDDEPPDDAPTSPDGESDGEAKGEGGSDNASVGVEQVTDSGTDGDIVDAEGADSKLSAQEEKPVGAMTKFKNKLVGFFGRLNPRKDKTDMKSSNNAAVAARRVKPKHILFFSIMAVIMIGVIVADIICGVMSDTFSAAEESVIEQVSAVTLASADDVVREIENEGIVLLKNENDALPLRKRAINVFGWASTPAGFIMSGSGSGDSGDRGGGAVQPVNFLDGLTKVGFRPNPELTKIYTKFKDKKDGTGGSLNDKADVFFKLYEPARAAYTPAVMNQALDYSDQALIVISRSGGEGQDLPYFQSRAQGTVKATSGVDIDNTRTYLELSPQEEDLIDIVTKAGFNKVVVVINAMNVMELGFLDNAKIDAAISVGGPGQTGCISIAKVLHGTVNPSGRTTDTFAYDLLTAPSYVNSGSTGVKQYNGMWAEMEIPNQSNPGTSYIDYAESIYVGYKWYETADAEHYWDDRGGYNNVVQYPFGYGLSYTNFEWQVQDVSPAAGSALTANGEITFTVRVTNKGSYSGKDVVQLYYTPPYTRGGIEKSTVNLCAYAKTPLIEPNGHADVTLKFKVSDMKSYDCYDLNNNGNSGYELDSGAYEVSLRKNAHEKASCPGSTATYTVGETIYYKEDVGENEVENRFTGESAYSGVSIDGVTSGENITYLTRNNFAGTFPTSKPTRDKSYRVAELGLNWYNANIVTTAPKTGSNGNLKLVSNDELNLELVLALGSDYDDERWKPLVEQITTSELNALVEDAGFQTAKIDSVGKPRVVDLDGPAGLNLLDNSGGSSFTVYPVEMVLSATWNDDLAFAMGQMVGLEAQEAKVSGWYAPGANIHRSPFDGRNFEYYSEDALLSGKMCANEVYGCLTKGLYPYMKHFAVNETERQRTGLNTWLTEQALREIYLRPFEIAVKEGHANAIMTSFNCIGAVWTGGNKALLEGIARGEWGFRGTMITDWSNGGDFMNFDQGLACGQDIWLNGGHGGAAGHNRKNTAAGISDMQRAAKNVLYTYCNTYYLANTAGESVELKTVNVGERHYGWLGIVIPLNVVLVAGVAVWMFFTIRDIRKTKKQEAATEGGVSDGVESLGDDAADGGEKSFCMNCGALLGDDMFCQNCGNHTDDAVASDGIAADDIHEQAPEQAPTEETSAEEAQTEETATEKVPTEETANEAQAQQKAAPKKSATKKSSTKKSAAKKAQNKESGHEE